MWNFYSIYTLFRAERGEESHRLNTVYGTYYQEPVTVDVDVAEYVKGNPLGL